MNTTIRFLIPAFVLAGLVTQSTMGASPAVYRSYPPLRPLPTASERPLATGPARFVDSAKGNDAGDGSEAKPWKSLAHAVARLAPGDTLYLRGGIYWEHVTAGLQGMAAAPITIRSYPGELAVLDGGYREFFEDPAGAWEPVAGGDGEFRSTRSYPASQVGGNFGDSMVPLRMYGSFVDLRSNLETEDREKQGRGVYVGPGVKRDDATGRIHIRLRHTTLAGLGDENYRGETDPRKLPLIIAGGETALDISEARHFRLQDIVIRGASTAVQITKAKEVTLDGVTVYAVKYALNIAETDILEVVHSAFRGFDAPWHPRASGTDVDCFCPLDLVTIESGGVMAFANNEFTDHHDCLQIGNVESFDFHHNLIERFNDDGIDIAFQVLGRYEVHENRIARCLTPFSIHDGTVSTETDLGLFIYRNVVDLRRGTYSHPPFSADDDSAEARAESFERPARLIGDHGGPTWPPIYFYHNTVLEKQPSWRAYYGSGLGYAGLKQTRRRVFNNVFVHHQLFGAKSKGFLVPAKPAEADLQIDGNLFWGLEDGSVAGDDFFAAFHTTKVFEESKNRYAPGWSAHDRVADPQFTALSADVAKPTNLTPRRESPAVNSGVTIPTRWPDDSLSRRNDDQPDIGAVPTGTEPWRIGIQGRLSVFP